MRLLFTILFFAVSAQAATHYVRDGGSDTGSNWTTAYDQLSTAYAAAARGDTIYIATGSYTAFAMSKAVSTTAPITIRFATIADHGTETGWDNSYASGVSDFSGALNITTAYHSILAPFTQTATWVNTGTRQIKFTGASNIGTGCCATVADATSITLEGVELDGGASGPSDVRTLESWDADNLTLRGCYVHDSGCDLISGNQMNNFLVEYTKLARNRQAEPGCHGDMFEYQITDAENFVFRYNWFEDIVGSYCFGAHGTPVAIDGYEVYGNIFYWTIEPFFGNGLMGTIGAGSISNAKFINNTLAGAITGDSGTLGISGNVTGEVRNNIWWRDTGTGFNIGLGATSSANTTYNGGATGAQETLTGDPFVGSGVENFELSSNSTTGTDVSATVTVDINGDTYESGGVWTRGFLAFGNDPPSGGAPSAYGNTARVGSIRSP